MIGDVFTRNHCKKPVMDRDNTSGSQPFLTWSHLYLVEGRGVQYVHWVMHKCIMVKVGGKNTCKVCKKQVNLCKTGGEICQSRGEIIIFSKQGGNVLKQEKWGEIRNFWSTTKKRSSEILADENQKIFREKVKLLTFSSESENFSKIGGNLHHGLRGMDTPAGIDRYPSTVPHSPPQHLSS